LTGSRCGRRPEIGGCSTRLGADAELRADGGTWVHDPKACRQPQLHRRLRRFASASRPVRLASVRITKSPDATRVPGRRRSGPVDDTDTLHPPNQVIRQHVHSSRGSSVTVTVPAPAYDAGGCRTGGRPRKHRQVGGRVERSPAGAADLQWL